MMSWYFCGIAACVAFMVCTVQFVIATIARARDTERRIEHLEEMERRREEREMRGSVEREYETRGVLPPHELQAPGFGPVVPRTSLSDSDKPNDEPVVTVFYYRE